MQPIQTSPVNLYNNNNNSNNKLFPFPPQQPPQQPQQKSMDPFGSLLWKMWNFTKFFRIFSRTLHHHCTPHLFLFFLVLLQPPFLLFHVFYPSTPTTLKKVGLFLWFIYFLFYLFFYWVSKVKICQFNFMLKKILTLSTYLQYFSLGPSHFRNLGGSFSEPEGGRVICLKNCKQVHCAVNITFV